MISFKTFLKSRSNIPDVFLEDFFSVFEHKRFFEPSIDLNLTIKWLKCRKGSLKETLVKSYKENEDYIINYINNNKKGRRQEIILITPETFKNLCMLSRSKRAQDVRDYYIELERVFANYTNELHEKIEERIKALENNQKPKDYEKGQGYIYVFKTDDGLIRIGRTRNLKERIRQHSSNRGDNINIIYKMKTDFPEKLEECLKTLLKPSQYRKNKEIYKIDIDTIKYLLSNCGKSTKRVQAKLQRDSMEGGFYLFLDRPKS